VENAKEGGGRRGKEPEWAMGRTGRGGGGGSTGALCTGYPLVYLKPNGMVYNSRNLIIRLVFMSMGIHMNWNPRCMVYNFNFVENSIGFDVYGYLNALEICFWGLQFNKL